MGEKLTLYLRFNWKKAEWILGGALSESLSLAQLTTNRNTIGEAKAPKLKAGSSRSPIIKGANYVLFCLSPSPTSSRLISPIKRASGTLAALEGAGGVK